MNYKALTYSELKQLIEERFEITNQWGTFASIKDYKSSMNSWQQEMFNKLKEYYDTNLLSVIMAPFFPEKSRNCIWQFKLKHE